MTKIAYEKAQVICIVHQCGAQLRLSLNDKKCGSKGGKGKTHKQGKISHNSNMQINYPKTNSGSEIYLP